MYLVPVYLPASTAAVLLSANISLARHRSPAAALVGYTRLCTGVPGTVNTVPYLVALCISTTFCSPMYVWLPLPVCTIFLLARRRSPAAALVGCTQQYTDGTLVAVPPPGVTRE